MIKSIMIVGVGGQGTLLSSRILGTALLMKGYDVKVSEVHGMSQRGGSVVTYVKYGDKVYSPVVGLGEADIILAFEQLEAARWLNYLKIGGKIVANTQKIDPMSVVIGDAEYPEGVIDSIKNKGVEIYTLDALSKAVEAGNPKSAN
ncbi:MAG: indolepyruvate oxidoreductase subunit beta, partial [Clostridia bacterium]|nr:indolepyruvate oxidoreductase subunit beta [Clostridia bacterium]